MKTTALQLILVITSDWDSHQGKMYRFERSACAVSFVSHGKPLDVVVGQKGIAWGLGIHPISSNILPERTKIEGDRKAPAGIFHIGPIFVDTRFNSSGTFKIPVIFAGKHYEAVDDPASSYYNQIVDSTEVGLKDWSSSELMHREDDLYHLGLLIQHNPLPAVPGRGSCIFMHRWRGSERGTDGCTALSCSDLLEVLTWLDQDKSPLIVQLPFEEFINLKEEWDLPFIF